MEKFYIFYAIIGILLLTLGRKLFWLFVGCVGFVAGLQMAQLYFGPEPFWIVWVAALFFGLIGALLALFFQTIAIGLGGFAAGSTISIYLAMKMGLAAVPLIGTAGGIVGAILLYLMFDWALIGLSSFAGATLIVQVLPWSSAAETVVYIVLIVAGIWFQAALLRKDKVTS